MFTKVLIIMRDLNYKLYPLRGIHMDKLTFLCLVQDTRREDSRIAWVENNNNKSKEKKSQFQQHHRYSG